jgi:plastocyanin
MKRELWFVIGIVIILSAFIGIFYRGTTGQVISGNENIQVDGEISAHVPKVYTVNINNYAFNPINLEIRAGDTIVWENKDLTYHTVTSEGDMGPMNSPYFWKGESYNHTFTDPGVYNYYCIPHPYMKGSITVTN